MGVEKSMYAVQAPSPLYVADLEETLKKGQGGGVVIEKEKIWTLGYAGDIVLLAENETEMEEMMERTRKYFIRKKLEVNEEKTKVMVARKGGGRRKEKRWRWGDKEIEEVKEIKYLGYIIVSNNRDKAHIRDRVKKAKMVMGKCWGIGERKFKGDIRWRLKLFDAVVKGILLFGAEIWGWKERQEIKSTQERYLRWILGVERTTPGYIVREELKRDKIRVDTGKRAGRLEEKIRRTEDRPILKACVEQRRKEEKNGRYSREGKERKLLLVMLLK